ncbi:MAG: FtsQ-type POTRA domain-containing protein [Thermoleophilia bacterium]|nr:FtsQ-type POTRA domain-containing protein [Thermoleophilia bacterium]
MIMPGSKSKLWWGMWGVLLLGVASSAFFWLSQSSLLAIEEIAVEGNHAIPEEEILARAAPLLMGESLLKPSFADVGRAIMENPFAEKIEIDRDFPNRVRIRVREYRPFVNLKAAEDKVFILSPEGRTLVEAAGLSREFPVLSTKEPCGVEPGITAECPDVSTGVWFLANIPVNFNHGFSEVLVADGDITATMTSGVSVHFGSLDDYGLKFEVMRQLLIRTAAAGAGVFIDVSVPDRPVIRNSAEPGGDAAAQAGEAPAEDQSADAEAWNEAQPEELNRELQDHEPEALGLEEAMP